MDLLKALIKFSRQIETENTVKALVSEVLITKKEVFLALFNSATIILFLFCAILIDLRSPFQMNNCDKLERVARREEEKTKLKLFALCK